MCKFILLVFSGGDSLLFFFIFQIQLLLLKYFFGAFFAPVYRLGLSVPRTLRCNLHYVGLSAPMIPGVGVIFHPGLGPSVPKT